MVCFWSCPQTYTHTYICIYIYIYIYTHTRTHTHTHTLIRIRVCSRRSLIDDAASQLQARLPGVDVFKWRVDVAISTSALKQVLKPSVLMEVTLSDGRIHTFEVWCVVCVCLECYVCTGVVCTGVVCMGANK